MGDRGNIAIRQRLSKEYIYLYTHWEGSELPETLQTALASPEGRGRWTDEAYLARIIFDHMTGLAGGETGFGISTSPPDNEHPFLVVDCARQVVEIHSSSGINVSLLEIAFQDYVLLADPNATVDSYA